MGEDNAAVHDPRTVLGMTLQEVGGTSRGAAAHLGVSSLSSESTRRRRQSSAIDAVGVRWRSTTHLQGACGVLHGL